MRARKSAVEKRDSAPPPEVKYVSSSKSKAYPVGNMLIASPRELEAVIRQIPAGAVMTLSALRDHLARRWQADYTCALTTGIFLRMVAEAAEQEGSGVAYWRVVRADGRLVATLPGGETGQAERLKAEGVRCITTGKQGRRVADLLAVAWHP
ncbi:MAG: MGMT family protein [Acidobacteria bacterium]|nr:MGMT family protein [Acidobacteriota bacterium]